MPQVAILIPTMNRPEFLIRSLRYYASVKSPHPVYIGDSSNAEHQERIENVIQELQSQIKLYYYRWPGLNDRQTIADLGKEVKEPYCAFIGDDDFFVPESLSKCVQYLEENPEYRTAQGKAVLFSLEKPGPFGAMDGFGPYWSNNEAEERTGVKRILEFGQNYWVPQFSVHRRHEFLEDSMDYGNIKDKSFGELLHSYTFIIKGKSKFIDCLYLFRQGHDARYVTPDIFDWITGPDWQPSFRLFMKSLTSALMETDRISESVAHEAVKQAFWAYLANGILRKYQGKYGQTSSSKQNAKINGNINTQESLRELVKKIPGTRQATALLRNTKTSIGKHFVSRNKEDLLARQAEKGKLTLPALLHSSSPYHDEFMPVYEVITGQPITLK